ncbi:MAG: DNA adenine methylase [Pontiellaceae bacterium]|nr:DNA adenine methylase [Pontiellaceae bacterium]MBN2785195.1 DNA adenine methylase [Pontiellaceae bacterium]
MTTTITQATSDETNADPTTDANADTTAEQNTAIIDKPMKSPLGYLGGKSRLAKRIVERIPEHTCYVEPFCGGAWVYFTKPQSRVEILNDRDGELVNFWRVVKNHLPEFLRCIDLTLVSREQFQLESKQDPSLLTDVQRAVRYYRLQRMGYGGKVVNRTFGTSSTRPSSLNLPSVEEQLRETHKRMARTTIENLDACDCIRKYDSPQTFFYIDPPYWNADFYAVSFSGKDFRTLAETLRTINGSFILSLNDTPEVRMIFSDFRIESIETKYSLGNTKVSEGTRGVERKEVLIHNLWYERDG